MTFAAALFAPLVLLLPGAAGGVHAELLTAPPITAPLQIRASPRAYAPSMLGVGTNESAGWQELSDAFRSQIQNQVRIEQRMTIRIIPRPSPRVNLLTTLPEREIANHYVEKKTGKCLQVSEIAGVQVNGPTGLILFMRDKRMITAGLERACRARDFYSGFYLAHSDDGKLCVDRDTLLSRSGAHCKLTRIRRLVAADD